MLGERRVDVQVPVVPGVPALVLGIRVGQVQALQVGVEAAVIAYEMVGNTAVEAQAGQVLTSALFGPEIAVHVGALGGRYQGENLLQFASIFDDARVREDRAEAVGVLQPEPYGTEAAHRKAAYGPACP